MKTVSTKYLDIAGVLMMYVTVALSILSPEFTIREALSFVIPQCLSTLFYPVPRPRVRKEMYTIAAFLYVLSSISFMMAMKHPSIELEENKTRCFILFIFYIYSAYLCLWCRGTDYELLVVTTTFLRIIILTLPYFSKSSSVKIITMTPIKDAIVVSLLIDTFASKLMSYIKKQRPTNETRGS